MENFRRSGELWLDPGLNARISCHTIEWYSSGPPQSLPAGDGLWHHRFPRSGSPIHSQDFAEIMLVSNGEINQRVNGEKRLLKTGSLCFIRPDDQHGFLPPEIPAKCEILVIDFALELFLSLSIYLENDVFLHQLTAPVLPPCFQLDPAECASLFNRSLRLNSPSESPQTRKVRLKILLGELFSKYFIEERNLLSGSQIPDWLEEICLAMRKEENFIAGLPRLRRLACRTPGHLCKTFHKYLGKSPTEFVNELRINHAARLLGDRRIEIQEIAQRLNFQSLSRFYKLFKHQYGQTPAAYRKRLIDNRFSQPK